MKLGGRPRTPRWAGVALLHVALTFAACGDSADATRDHDASGDVDAGLVDAAVAPDAQTNAYAQLADGTAGKICKTNADCEGDQAVCSPFGVCTGLCKGDENCGAGGTCVTLLAGFPGQCSKRCEGDTECGAGLACREGYEFGGLRAAAADAGVNLDDAGIDLTDVPKTCGPPLQSVQLDDGVVGSPCGGNTQCGAGECAQSLYFFINTPAGYCTGPCTEDAQCGKGGVCYRDVVARLAKTEGTCLLGCTESDDACRKGQSCGSSALLGEGRYCLPRASESDAGAFDAGAANDAGTLGDADAQASDAEAQTDAS